MIIVTIIDMLPYTDALNKQSRESVHRLVQDKYTVILDLGCGNGRTTFPLLDRATYVFGVDISQAMIDAANSTLYTSPLLTGYTNRIKFNVGSFCHIPYEAVEFDAVVMYNSLHFLPLDKVQEFLYEIVRVCPDGPVIISEPGEASKFAFDDTTLLRSKLSRIRNVRKALLDTGRITTISFEKDRCGYRWIFRIDTSLANDDTFDITEFSESCRELFIDLL